mgnify:CR=1 FL=1
MSEAEVLNTTLTALRDLSRRLLAEATVHDAVRLFLAADCTDLETDIEEIALAKGIRLDEGAAPAEPSVDADVTALKTARQLLAGDAATRAVADRIGQALERLAAL